MISKVISASELTQDEISDYSNGVKIPDLSASYITSITLGESKSA